MPKARNCQERCRQVLAWLEEEWPCGRTVILEWAPEVVEIDTTTGKKHQCYGETWRDGRVMRIVLSLRCCRKWKDATATLIHEYVHAMFWGPARIEFDERVNHHPMAFYVQEGEILDRWNHDHGAEQASEYPVG